MDQYDSVQAHEQFGADAGHRAEEPAQQHCRGEQQAEAGRRRQPGAFPPVGSAMTVKRRAYVLADDEGRTWLALDPLHSDGGVMQPLVAGQSTKVTSVEEDGVVLRVTAPNGISGNLDAFLLPRRMVPPAIDPPA